MPPGVAVAVYEEIGSPPVLDGTDHDTVAPPTTLAAVTLVGAPGVVAGVTAVAVADDEGPLALEATTANV